MNNLSSFLKENAIKIENIKYVTSKRFIDKDGKPIEWELQAITTEEDEEIKGACTKRVPIAGKKYQYVNETDYPLYMGKLAARCIVYPNLNNAELQNSYGAMGADALLKRMLTAGEYTDLLSKVQEINGFDIQFEDKVKEAKN